MKSLIPMCWPVPWSLAPTRRKEEVNKARLLHHQKSILILLPSSVGGGAEKMVLEEMKHFDKEEFNLHVITLRRGNIDDQFQAQGSRANYSSLDSKKRRVRFSLAAWRQLMDYVHRHDIDLIHTHLIEADMYGFLLKLRFPQVKLVSTKHNTNEYRKRKIWCFVETLFAWPADLVIAVSGEVKKELVKYNELPAVKIKVIYNAVDTDHFRKSDDTVFLRDQWGLSETDFVVGIVAQLTEQKGHKYLFKAVARLKDRIPGCKVLAIGQGVLKEKLESIVNNLEIDNIVKFLGFRDDLEKLYSLMDVFVLPSKYEGLPVAVVEAMSAERIVICSAIGGNMEIIDDGVDGILVPPGGAKKLSQVIWEVYQNGEKYQHMGEKARKKVIDKHDSKKMVRMIEEEYRALLITGEMRG